MALFLSVFESVFKRRDVKILFLFALLPILLPFLSITSAEELAKSDFLTSFLSFFSSSIETQYKLLLPVLMLGLVISSVFRDEIDSKIMFLYKDISRKKVFHAKLLSLFVIYGIYVLITFILGVIIYYTYMVPTYHLSGAFFAISAFSSHFIILNILGVFAVHLIFISLVAAQSIKRPTLQAILIGLLYILVSMTGPLLVGFKYVIPNSYMKLLGTVPFGIGLVICLALSLIYSSLAYYSAYKNFMKIEF